MNQVKKSKIGMENTLNTDCTYVPLILAFLLHIVFQRIT